MVIHSGPRAPYNHRELRAREDGATEKVAFVRSGLIFRPHAFQVKPSPTRDCTADVVLRQATAANRSFGQRRGKAPHRPCHRAEAPPSQETGEVRSLCGSFHRQASLQAPTRAGVEEKMKTTFLRSLLLALLCFLVSVVSLQARSKSESEPRNGSRPEDAHLSGILQDASGGGIPGVRVMAHLDGDTSAQLWTSTSTTDGAYALALPPGKYRVQFLRSSFAPRELVIDLTAGEFRKLDLRLDLERLSSSVIVTTQPEPILAQDVSASVTVITRDEIEQRQAVPLADLLLYTPGIAIGRNAPEGGLTSFFLDGGNSYHTKVLIDGATVNNPGGQIDFSNFTLDNIDKVEVVRGAESAIYGTDAVAGVIQLFTHRGETRVPAFSVFGEGGSFSSGRGGAQLSGLLGKFDYSGAASYFETDGQGVNDSFRNRTLSGNFGYTFSDSNQLRLSLRNNTSDAGIPGQTQITPPSLHQINDLENFSSNARWNFATGTHWHHEISGSEAYNRTFSANPVQSFYATDPFAGCPQANLAAVATPEFCDFVDPGSTLRFNRASLNAHTSYILSKFTATAGYQYEVENADISFLGIGHLRRNNQGGYVDFRYRPHPRASLDLGVRAEVNSAFGTRVVPRVGASLALRYGKGLWGDTRYRISYGQGIIEPQFSQSFGSDPCAPGNPALKPEESKTWNTGIEQKLADDHAKVSFESFSNRFYDVISFTSCFPLSPCTVPQPPNCPFFWGNFFNTDLARARGVNLAAEVHFLHWFNIAGTYTYDDSLVIKAPNAFDPAQIPGNRLIRRPPHSGTFTLNAAYHRLTFLFAGYFSGPRTDSDFLGLGLTRNPGYARFDIAGSYNFARSLTIYVHATNLFDRRYQEVIGVPTLGRDVRVGLKYQFSGHN
jgi:vitamin B12 transporter